MHPLHRAGHLSRGGQRILRGMQKPAPNTFPIHQLIRERWSPRAFAAKAVPDEALRSLFEAARWAPSSNNEQPWAFIVARKDDQETFEKVLGTLVEFNASWAKNAPVLVIAVAALEFARNHAPNRNAQYDTGAAAAMLSIQATALGLAVQQMAGFDPQKGLDTFGIPAGWEAIVALAIGYPGDLDSGSGKLKDRELATRTRKPISESVMTSSWGQTARFAAK